MTLRRERSAESGGVRRDTGFSLVEVTVAVVLLGLAGVAVLGAAATSSRGSAEHRRIANAQAWLASAADRIVSPALPKASCTSAVAAYSTAILGAERPEGFQSANLTVAAVVSGPSSGAFRTTTCDPSEPLQRVTLKVTGSDASVMRQLDVVKAAPPDAPTPSVTLGVDTPDVVDPPTAGVSLCPLLLALQTAVHLPTTVLRGLAPNGSPSPLVDGFRLDLGVQVNLTIADVLNLNLCADLQLAYNTGTTQVVRPIVQTPPRCKIVVKVLGVTILDLQGVCDLLSLTGLDGLIRADVAVVSSVVVPASQEPWTSGSHQVVLLDKDGKLLVNLGWVNVAAAAS